MQLELQRAPLKRGNEYQYPGYKAGFIVQHVCFRGHPEDDGGLTGVSVQWLHHKPGGMESGFYMFASEDHFWKSILFHNAYDVPPNA